ncbi:craniofacial development protein 2, partial [Biomphalaria glabrata]
LPTEVCRYRCSCQYHVYLGQLAKRCSRSPLEHGFTHVSSVRLAQDSLQVSVESFLGFRLRLQRGSESTDNSDVSRASNGSLSDISRSE